VAPGNGPAAAPNHPHPAFDSTAVDRELAALTAQYGVNVRLEYANLRSRYGDQRKDRIRLSRYIATDAQAIDTLRHEYAHAVAELKHRSKAKHGALWRRLALEMGARPRSTGLGPLIGVPLFEPTCNACGHCHAPRARRLRRARCRACGSGRIAYQRVVRTRFGETHDPPG
jgi:hypothetical protein